MVMPTLRQSVCQLAGTLVQGVLLALRDAPIKTQILELTAHHVPRDGTLTSLAQAEYVRASVRMARMLPLSRLAARAVWRGSLTTTQTRRHRAHCALQGGSLPLRTLSVIVLASALLEACLRSLASRVLSVRWGALTWTPMHARIVHCVQQDGILTSLE